MSDNTPQTPAERPKPQYGEYATREEQLAHIKSPAPEQLEPSAPRPVPAGPGLPAGSPGAPGAPGQAGQNPMLDPAVIAANRNRFNRVATIAFLAYGLVEILMQVPGFLNLGVLVNDYLTAMGNSLGTTFDTYVPGRAASVAGVALVLLWVGLWVLAVLWSWARMRRNKLSIWVPFVAGIVANLALGVVMVVLIFRDPTLLQQIMSVVGGS